MEDLRPARRANRLASEKSPYLLQHSSNPVDWYPWGDEAFARAEAEDRPIFLSIGYSTCHWCHVMERESFEDAEVARLLDEGFVAIKVDREERPDLDSAFMAVCQALTGAGGWPLTVVLSPDRQPFFAGTYFPRESRFGRVGLLELLPRIATVWRDRRDEVLGSAQRIAEAVGRMAAPEPGGELDAGVLDLALRRLEDRFDPVHGGFGRAPKFPSPHVLGLLLRLHRRGAGGHALAMADRTLEAMRRGGVFDQIGLGFHRYSTDSEWLVPHFEKMLYDQALLLLAYTEGHLATGRAEHGRTAREIAQYMLRDLRSPEGAFFSAEDADSEGEEGRFYLWTTAEVRRLLPDADAELFERAYGLVPEGNHRDEATGRATGLNVPHVSHPVEQLSVELGLEPREIEARLASARQVLFEARSHRTRPALDDKVLADWNGLAIAALARAGAALDEPELVDAAKRAAAFVLDRMVTTEGRLLHRWREDEAAIEGFLDDYAMMAWGLLELHAATFEAGHLRDALGLVDRAVDLFWDDRGGGFFHTARGAEVVLARRKDAYDGALPSGSSVAASCLVRLARLTGRADLDERAAALFRAFAASVARLPEGHAFLLGALALALGPSREVVVAGAAGAEQTEAMLDVLRRGFLPDAVALLRPPGEAGEAVVRLAPHTATMLPSDGRTTAYVCTRFACADPVTDPEELRRALYEKSPSPGGGPDREGRTATWP